MTGFVLDTDVVAELAKPVGQRSASVFAWTSRQNPEHLYVTAISLAEMLSATAILEDGQTRHILEDAIARIFREVFGGRLLGFDDRAAQAYAELIAVHRISGLVISTLDMQVAAIAKANHLALASGNTGAIAHCGVSFVNPWETQAA